MVNNDPVPRIEQSPPPEPTTALFRESNLFSRTL